MCHFNRCGNLPRNGIRHIGNTAATDAQVAGASALVHVVGVDNGFVTVGFVDVIWVYGIGTSFKIADFTAEPHIARRNHGSVNHTAGNDEVGAPVKDGAHAQRQFLKVQDVIRIGISSAGFGNIFFHGVIFLLG